MLNVTPSSTLAILVVEAGVEEKKGGGNASAPIVESVTPLPRRDGGRIRGVVVQQRAIAVE